MGGRESERFWVAGRRYRGDWLPVARIGVRTTFFVVLSAAEFNPPCRGESGYEEGGDVLNMELSRDQELVR